MDLYAVSKMEEMTDIKKVNQYLELGWKLLHIYSTAYDTRFPGANFQTAHYVIGWLDGEPQYPPKEKEWDGTGNPFGDWD